MAAKVGVKDLRIKNQEPGIREESEKRVKKSRVRNQDRRKENLLDSCLFDCLLVS
jgi:hypothetical protein